jgi:hypothetical protein
MTWLVLALIVAVLTVIVIRKERNGPNEPPDPEAAMRAAVELHAIHRRIDVALTKSEQKREASRLRREIAEALDDDVP